MLQLNGHPVLLTDYEDQRNRRLTEQVQTGAKQTKPDGARGQEEDKGQLQLWCAKYFSGLLSQARVMDSSDVTPWIDHQRHAGRRGLGWRLDGLHPSVLH